MPHLKKKKKSVDYFEKNSIFITEKSLLEKSYLFAFHRPLRAGGLCYVSVMPVSYTTWLLVESKIKVAFESHVEEKKKKQRFKSETFFQCFGFLKT